MRDLSPEQRRDAQKFGHGSRLGFVTGQAGDEAYNVAMGLISGSADAWATLKSNLSLAPTVASELRAEGEFELAKQVLQIPGAAPRHADEIIRMPVKESSHRNKGNHAMRITESQLRKMVREVMTSHMLREEDEDVITDPDEIKDMITGLTGKYMPRLKSIWVQVVKTNPEAKSSVSFSFTVKQDGTVDPNSVKVTCKPDFAVGDPTTTGEKRTLATDIAKSIKDWKFYKIVKDTPYTRPPIEFKAVD